MKEIKILGAGISGLVAGIILAKNNYQVKIFEKRSRVGSFFKKDVHSLRNYLYDYDVIDEYKRLGIDISNIYPVFKEFRYSPSLKCLEIYSKDKPLFYNFLRGYEDEHSLDNELLKIAKNCGVQIFFNHIIDLGKEINIVATGASSMKIMGYGGHYKKTSNVNAVPIHYFLDNRYAPQGYIYITPFFNEFSLVITTTKIEDKEQLKKRFNAFLENNSIIKKNLENAEFKNEIFGYASFNIFKSAVKANKLYIGEAAGFLDAATGFGTHYAIISGYLAAKTIINNENYNKLWKEYFGKELKARYSKRMRLQKLKIIEQEKIIEDLIEKYGNKISFKDYRKIKEKEIKCQKLKKS